MQRSISTEGRTPKFGIDTLCIAHIVPYQLLNDNTKIARIKKLFGQLFYFHFRHLNDLLHCGNGCFNLIVRWFLSGDLLQQ